MAATFTFSFEGQSGRMAMEALEESAGDLTPLMEMFGTLLEGAARDRIEDTNVSPSGIPWPPSMRAAEDGGKTLFESGRLAASLTNLAGPQSVEIGTNLIYSGTHQSGATILPVNGDALQFALPGGGFATVASVTIPARPFLGVSDDDAREMQDLTTDWLEDLIGGAP